MSRSPGTRVTSRADLEGGAPGARPPKIFPNTIFYYNIVQVRGLEIDINIVLKFEIYRI